MTCARCGSSAVRVVESEGGTRSGRFREEHRCAHCDAWGIVSGDASDQAEHWDRLGPVFDHAEVRVP